MILIYHLCFNVRMQLECIHKLCSAKVLKRIVDANVITGV